MIVRLSRLFIWLVVLFATFSARILKKYYQVFIGLMLGLVVVLVVHAGLIYTSTDDFCNICHGY